MQPWCSPPTRHILQADVELAQLEQRKIELDQEREIAIARINTLLHRRPDHPLPPPPQALAQVADVPTASALRTFAVDQRPELQALAARIQAEQTAVELACKEFLPDFEFMGRYDRFWTDKEQRGQVGMNVNMPLNQSRRHAAMQEPMFQVRKMQAELEQATNNIRNDVQMAYARVQAGIRTVKVYDTKILPVASQNLSAARNGYTAGTVDKGVEAETLDTDKFRITEQMQMLTAVGGKVLACGTCLKLRQTEGTEMCPISRMNDLHQLVVECDKVLTF